MITNRLRILVATLWLLFFTPQLIMAEAIRIGVVDVSYLLEQFSEIKEIKTLLEKEFAAKDAALKRIHADVKDAQLLLENAAEEEQQRQFERQILNLEREYTRLSDEFRQDFNLRRNEELYKIQKQITNAILEFSKKNNYDLILESGVIYAEDRLSITNQVLELLVSKLK